MKIKTSWRKLFRWQQKSGWCGPAVIQMALASGGINSAQDKIAKDVFQPWWGTTQQAMYAYLSKYYKSLNFKDGAKIKDLEYHLAKDRTVIVNWWDDLDGEKEQDGHYSLVLKVDKEKGTITLADPSEGRGIWEMKIKDFNKRWYDTLDLAGKKWVEGWFLWLDPKSRIPK